MSELSPDARAVLTAVTLKRYDVPPEGLPAFAEEMAPLIAAALRAAADQVVPEYETTPGGSKIWPSEPVPSVRAGLLAIADELEGGAS